jgi:putative membrane protein
MSKIYINKKEVKKTDKKDEMLIMLLELIVSAATLMLASWIFKGFYVENIIYALLTALLISVLNTTIKPFLIYLTLPVTIMSWGLLYPLVNVIILKLASLLMGSAFIVEGWILPFFIAIFISIMTPLLHRIFIKPFLEGR